MKKKKITKELLEKKYLTELKNPYEIAKELSCDHKTIRSYLRHYDIQLRTPSEYNYLSHKTHISPSQSDIYSNESIAAHIAYLCEGWHTEKTSMISFSNQDTQLIDLVSKILITLYRVNKININIHTKDKINSRYLEYKNLYPEATTVLDKTRKNPIIVVRCGGKILAREFIENCYTILRSMNSKID